MVLSCGGLGGGVEGGSEKSDARQGKRFSLWELLKIRVIKLHSLTAVFKKKYTTK